LTAALQSGRTQHIPASRLVREANRADGRSCERACFVVEWRILRFGEPEVSIAGGHVYPRVYRRGSTAKLQRNCRSCFEG